MGGGRYGREENSISDFVLGVTLMESNAQECIDRLTGELLGKNYTIASPVGGNQGRRIITDEIIKKYKKPPTLKQRIKYIVEKW